MRSHLHFSMGAELIFSTICGDKMASGPRTKPKVRSVLFSVVTVHCAVKCNAMLRAVVEHGSLCTFAKGFSVEGYILSVCGGAGARDAMMKMKRRENGLLRREMKIRVVTQTRLGVSPLPT